MNRLVFNVTAGAVAFAVALPVFAATTSTPLRERARDIRSNVQEEVRGIRENLTQRAQEARESLTETFKQEREAIRSEIRTLTATSSIQGVSGLVQTKREKFRKLAEAQREEFKKAVEVKREEAKQLIKTKREELKNQLQVLNDERKAQVVAKIYDSVNALNGRLTAHYLAVLDQIDKVLMNVESRADKAAAAGRDVSAVRLTVTSAEDSIAVARTAVQAQAAKVYSVVVNAPSTVRSDVGVTRQALYTDLSAVKQVLTAARDAVHEAAVVLAQIPRVDEEPVAAPAPTPVSKQ